MPGAVPHPSRGRPRKYGDEQLLARLGMYRLGPRIFQTADVRPEVRAVRRYAFLAPEWRHVLSLHDFVAAGCEVKSMRKRANKLRQSWDVKAAWQKAIENRLTRTDSEEGI